LGIFYPKSKRYFTQDEIKAFEAFSLKSSSKKPTEVRRQELLKITISPLASFFEEHLQFYLLECNKN
jgi:hypothetical protein